MDDPLVIKVDIANADTFKDIVQLLRDILEDPEIVYPQQNYEDYQSRLRDIVKKSNQRSISYDSKKVMEK